MSKITIPKHITSLEDKIEYLRSQKPVIDCPKPPKLPESYVFPRKPDLNAMTAYAKKLTQYVEDRRKYDKEYEVYAKSYQEAKPQAQSIEDQVISLINEDVGLTKLGLSEKKVAKLWEKAREDANSEYEAISNLRELVELFED